jgi:RNA polymerase sigma factor (sigma-70 family)
MNVEKHSDKAILNGIRTRKDSILEYLYREYYPQIFRIVAKHGGDEHDARDLFQEALIIIFNRLKNEDLQITTSFHNYFIVLCRFIWFRQNNIISDYDTSRLADESSVPDEHDGYIVREGEVQTDNIYEEYLNNKSEKIFQRHYRKLPGDCKRVLKMFFRKRSFRDIAGKMNYSGENYARRKKYLCMQQLMKMINQDPEYIALKNRKPGSPG